MSLAATFILFSKKISQDKTLICQSMKKKEFMAIEQTNH
ncbi:hypothetical protein HMPREF1512_0951 [Streptococcus sp. OBRC6]|nr:hypothetical protein HMPREF1512_0951 [Streptococcus sp. OBRC6]EUB18048.1 hypothetical protein HMPREF1510_1228 [Streptococcus sp. ACC21]EUC76213.1 hypothetical protein HMPREF1511_1683 [Streptococcus sp. CM7]EWC97316.1 hypothetical protein HMPREF1509_1572 [Streptococcus sp. AC15]